MPDVEALRKLRAAGMPALLYGPPGTGKTSLIEAAFPDLITVAGDGDTQVSDLTPSRWGCISQRQLSQHWRHCQVSLSA
jgi:Cdc6-like AAA superfamily ATPase